MWCIVNILKRIVGGQWRHKITIFGHNVRTRMVGGQWRNKITMYGTRLSVYIHIWQIRDVTTRQLFTCGYKTVSLFPYMDILWRPCDALLLEWCRTWFFVIGNGKLWLHIYKYKVSETVCFYWIKDRFSVKKHVSDQHFLFNISKNMAVKSFTG